MKFSRARRSIVLAALASTILALPVSQAAAEDVTIPVIVKDTTSYYWQIVLAGARKAGKDLGVSVPELGAQSESDINGQIAILENAVSSGSKAIVIAPTEYTALGAPIDQAAKSVPIVGLDSAPNSQALTSFLSTDNVQGGRNAADALAVAIGEANGGKVEGEVALIKALAGSGSVDARVQGFEEQLAAKYPGLKLVYDKVADGQAATALNMTTDLLTANPNIKGIFASNLIMAQGAGQGIAENNVKDTVALVGFDSDDKLVGFLKEGVIDALIVQDPFRMGYDGVKTAFAVVKGEKVEAKVDTGVSVITTKNIDEARSQELLNPKIN
ncbi:Ribose import binding protein RbsB [Ensifer adhaerens]|uniref:ABC transporter substrate-binding protein n=1 Tax=Ensifer adhaerens TaxID=106592 RepID=UPI001568221C|nr:ABC transporter substrate-binding protein [Ensifer adhaerens]NRP21775.1 Ribose import binding protein RbsB [Ensifer adhaerens]